MELGVAERIILLNILPREGDLTTLRIVRDLQTSLSFTEEEHKIYNFRVEDNKTFWDNDDRKVEIGIGDKAMGIIREAIKRATALRYEWLPLCDRFLS